MQEGSDEAERSADPRRHPAESERPPEPHAEKVAGPRAEQEQEAGGGRLRDQGIAGMTRGEHARSLPAGAGRDLYGASTHAFKTARNGWGKIPIASVPTAQMRTTAVRA